MSSQRTTTDELNHGIDLANWVVEGDAHRLVEYAVTAEEAGCDGVFLADHLIFPQTAPDEEREERGRIVRG